MLASLCKSWKGSKVSEERRRLIKRLLVLSWGRDSGEEACSVSGATDGDGGDSFWKESALLLVFVVLKERR